MLPTNIAFIIDKWPDFQCWFTMTGKLAQPWTLGASSAVVTWITGAWAEAKQRLKKKKKKKVVT